VLFNVSKYIPEGLYGFLVGEDGARAFFHLSEFHPGVGGPPPITGEPVEVARLEENGDKAPRAREVTRLRIPEFFTGTVTRFDPNVGYGFVTVEGRQFFLHRSELANGDLPRIGMIVSFFAGDPTVAGKPPRACYASIIDRGTA